jgi:hypothetical protein
VSKQRKRLPTLAGVLAAGALLVGGLAACTQPPPAGNPTQPGQVKVRYGPFTIPGAGQPSTGLAAIMPFLGLQPETGMVWNQPVQNIKKPCGACYVTGMVAGLEYADGSNANINTGVWLHHMVLMARGAGKSDATCAANPFSLPHFAVGGTGANTERFFASGNERTGLKVPQGLNYGYQVNQADSWHLLVDLMNENAAAKQVYMTMTYDYVPATTPGIKPMKPLWLDINQCGTSEVAARTGKYNVKSVPWTSTINGQWLGVGGHLHDGGTNLTIEQNSQVICDSQAKYGTKPDYVSGDGGMDHGGGDPGHGHGGMMHISEHGVCYADTLPRIKAGDRVAITANYDDTKYPQMVHNGRLHNIMGIAIAYIAP